jgi:hypothetical protein
MAGELTIILDAFCLRIVDLITYTFDPHPQPLSQNGRGEPELLVPLLPSWEKGLGDEGVQSVLLLSNSVGYLIHNSKRVLLQTT